MHLRVVVLLALPTLLLSQSQSHSQSQSQEESPTAQASATQPEQVQTRMAGVDSSTGNGYWSRCVRHGSDSQRQERRQPEAPPQRQAEPDSSYQPDKQSYSGDTHHSEEQVQYHASYAPLPYQASLPGFGYIAHPRRAYYEGTSMNYPYQHSAAQYAYPGHNY